MKKFLPLVCLLLGACSGYKTPTLDNPQGMSADTLCYRAAYARSSQALHDEIAARNLDCGQVLQSRAVLQE